VAKLTTAKQAVAVTSEVLECFGGAGYLEDTGLPVLLRDAQVLPIWEGTTNVLSLDTLRALRTEGGFEALLVEAAACRQAAREPVLAELAEGAVRSLERAGRWLAAALEEHGRESAEAGARRFALTLGRCLALALLVRHAQWSLDEEEDGRARGAARRFAAAGVDLLGDLDRGPGGAEARAEAAALADDRALSPEPVA
jgi:hypothetical protein